MHRPFPFMPCWIAALLLLGPALAQADETDATIDLVASYDAGTDEAAIDWYPSQRDGSTIAFEINCFNQFEQPVCSQTVDSASRSLLLTEIQARGIAHVQVLAVGADETVVESSRLEALFFDSSAGRQCGPAHPLRHRAGVPAHRAELGLSLVGCDSQNFPFIYITVRATLDGQPYGELTAGDFSVTEDGRPQTDSFDVTPPEQGGGVRSADVVFLIDTSGSMGAEIAAVRNNAIAFANALAASDIDYRLGLVQFGNSSGQNPRVVGGDLTADVNQFVSWVSTLGASGSWEPGFAAIRLAIQSFSFRPGAQTVFLLISDEDSDDRQKQATIDLILANEVTVHCAVDCGQGSSNGDYCDETSVRGVSGGLLFGVEGPYDEVLDEIAQSIGNSYIVHYRTDNPVVDGQERHVVCTATHDASSDFVECTYIACGAPQIQRTAETLALHGQPLVEGGAQTISVRVTDAAAPYVEAVTLHVRTSGTGSGYTELTMSPQGNDIYAATVPGSLIAYPGCDYYIRATDGQVTSSDPSVDPATNPYQLAVLPNVAPVIEHVPTPWTTPGQELPLSIHVVDDTFSIAALRVFHRRQGTLRWSVQEVEYGDPGPTVVDETVIIPADDVQEPVLEYYIEATDNLGVSGRWPVGGAQSPFEVLVSFQQSFEWQRVRVVDPSSRADRPSYDEYAVHVLSDAIPPNPASFVYPSQHPDPRYRAVRIAVYDANGNLVDPVSDRLLVRKVLAQAHNAAVYRGWAGLSGDPIPVLSLADGFEEVQTTPPYSWFWGLITLPGGTDTSFGYDFPGHLIFPDEYAAAQGASRLVDWSADHQLLEWILGYRYVHPPGLKYDAQRQRVYEELLEHIVLQDGVKELEEHAAERLVELLEMTQVGLAVEGYVEDALLVADILAAIHGHGGALEVAIKDVLPMFHLNRQTMVNISRTFKVQNHYTGWARKSAPVVGFFLDLGLTALERDLQLKADHFAALVHAVMLQAHGQEILVALEEELFEAGYLSLDPALAAAFDNVKEELSGDTLEEFYVHFFDELAQAQAAGHVIDDAQLVLSAATAIAAVVPGGQPVAAVLGTVNLAVSLIRLYVDWLIGQYEHEELQQAVVVCSTLEHRWFDCPMHDACSSIVGGIPNEHKLTNIGWLVSTKLFQSMFVADKVLEDNSDWFSCLLDLLGNTEIERRRVQLRAIKARIENVMFGGWDPDPMFSLIAGRKLDRGEYLGFVPRNRLNVLCALTVAQRRGRIEPGLRFRLHSPGDIGIVDPAGRPVGTFHVPGCEEPVNVNLIPGATDTGSGSEPREITIPDPIPGDFEIHMMGLGEGNYMLDVEGLNGETVVYDYRAEGVFEAGVALDGLCVVSFVDGVFHVDLPQPPIARGRVQGIVRNADTDEPVPLALVSAPGAWTESGPDGAYDLVNIVPGEIAVEVSCAGYRAYRGDPFVLQAGEVITLDVALTPLYDPVAVFQSPPDGGVDEVITFDASESYDIDGRIVLFEWDWDGDGCYDTHTVSPITTHVWNSPYAGVVQLRVMDNDLRRDTAEAAICVGLSDISFATDVGVSAVRHYRATGNSSVTLKVTNTSDTLLEPFMVLAIHDLTPAEVSVVGADGWTAEGVPYVQVWFEPGSSGLAPGESAACVVYLDNAECRPFHFETTVYGAMAGE